MVQRSITPTLPTQLGVTFGSPDEHFDLGFLTFGTPDASVPNVDPN